MEVRDKCLMQFDLSFGELEDVYDESGPALLNDDDDDDDDDLAELDRVASIEELARLKEMAVIAESAVNFCLIHVKYSTGGFVMDNGRGG